MSVSREGRGRKRCERNRKRSKRRAIYCPIHGCYLDSASRKYPLFADKAEHLRDRGMARRAASMIIGVCGTVPLTGEWLEALWCQECQQVRWYHIQKQHGSYIISTAPQALWMQVSGVIHPRGNPSVSDFTRRQARMSTLQGLRGFSFSR